MNKHSKTSAFAGLLALVSASIGISGCKSSESNGTVRSLSLRDGITIELAQTPKGFWIGTTEVTQAQWKSVMGDNPAEFKGDSLPIESVSWNDCNAFFEKLNALPSVKTSGLSFRFPTDAEWEFACRAGSTGRFCKTDDGAEITDETLPDVAWMKTGAEGKTHSVGEKKPNAFGLFDMIGNVDEWVADTYGSVDSDAKGKDYADERVTRGGNYGDKASFCSSGVRGRNASGNKSKTIGLRLCADHKGD